MQVAILGPNLPRPLCDKGDIHAHAAGCADIARRYPAGRDQGGWVIEAASIQEIIEDVYGDQMHDYDPPAPWSDYEGDVWLAPCVRELPREATQDEPMLYHYRWGRHTGSVWASSTEEATRVIEASGISSTDELFLNVVDA